MDVITFFADDAASRPSAARKRVPSAVRAARVSPAISPRRLAFSADAAHRALAAFRDVSALSSFPATFALALAALLALTPLAQSRLGFYRLGRLSFPSDSRSELAMRSIVTPEPDATLLAAAGDASVAELPASLIPVSYRTYTVRSGDTVSSVAARFGIRNISSILSVNGIPNARRIKTGQKLTIPSIDGLLYTVVRGDSLERIAGRYSVPVTALLDANDLSAATLSAGQRIFVPGATLSAYELKKALGELFIYPISGRLTSRYGWRSDPFTGVRTFHTGIDLAAPIGTRIKATLDGTVATSGYSSVYGNYVIVTHNDGYQSLYGHMSRVAVKRGDSIAQGGTIGYVGNTGYSTGSHLHLSVYKNGKMVDPLSLLK
jgi:murein DD-endopeptidase MepM/ murein hydrolase activator NlpD